MGLGFERDDHFCRLETRENSRERCIPSGESLTRLLRGCHLSVPPQRHDYPVAPRLRDYHPHPPHCACQKPAHAHPQTYSTDEPAGAQRQGRTSNPPMISRALILCFRICVAMSSNDFPGSVLERVQARHEARQTPPAPGVPTAPSPQPRAEHCSPHEQPWLDSRAGEEVQGVHLKQKQKPQMGRNTQLCRSLTSKKS